MNTMTDRKQEVGNRKGNTRQDQRAELSPNDPTLNHFILLWCLSHCYKMFKQYFVNMLCVSTTFHFVFCRFLKEDRNAVIPPL